ncbi:MAG: EAL domain-containing protein [Magnetococcales bacterium]|nr:EAL domain-containing protein [Magnetococcales bacterium]NGZ06085.1 EAL domain-containing protein [Magnetococcales bacterium]
MKLSSYRWLPVWVFLAGLVVTYVSQSALDMDAHEDVQREFEYQGREIVSRIMQRMRAQEQVLFGVKGLFDASDTVERKEFQHYVSSLHLNDRYPGIQGVGFSLVIPPEQKTAHIDAIRQQGFPQYAIRPDGERPLYSSIIYLEPFAGRNLRAFGYDMFSESVRRTAMERARDSGESALSGKVTLVQEDGKEPQAGFLMYVPVYRNGVSVASIEERRAHLVGWAYSPFRVNDLMAGILGRYAEGLDLEIYDGQSVTSEGILYDSSPSGDHRPLFSRLEQIEFAGHQWTLRVRSLPIFEGSLDHRSRDVIRFAGILASILFALIVWQLVTARERAAALAEEMTRELRKSELDRERSAALVRAVVDTAVNAIIAIDANKIVHMFNPAAERFFGYRADEVIGHNINRLMPSPTREAHDGYVDHYLETGERKVIGIGREVVCQRQDRSTFPAELFVSEMQVSGMRMFVGVINDITERKQAEEVLILSRRVFEHAGEAILITGADGLITDVNPAYEKITGYRKDEVLGKSPGITKSGRHDAEFYRVMWSQLIQEGFWEGEIWDRRKNGEVFPKWVSISAIRNAAHELTHYMAIFLDISDQKAVEHKLERLAFYDALTGLPNRMFFQERLAQDIARARRMETQVVLMFIDLDRFKWVNDTLGHAAGDELLKEISQRLKGCVRETDTVARLGGDEFTIILNNLNSSDHAAMVAQKLIMIVREPVLLMGQNVYVGASVGIALFPADSTNQETLIKHADMAMYQAKEAGRNTFRFSSSEVHSKAFDRIAMEDDLYKALDRQELVPFYQPKWDLEKNALCGAEALVRWLKPDGKLVNPGQFIPLAEETGLIVPIGKRILSVASHNTARWTHERTQPFKMAVNLSSREFQQTDLLEQIRGVLEQTGLPAERLEIEITESMVMGNVEKAIGIMKKLRELGISLAMDDFGTGYSSLGYLKRFPLNTLKIDQSFVRDLPDCHGDGAIVEAILSMARGLKLHVVAEGVETEEQRAYLMARGCESIQGYLIGRPMPEQDFLRFMGGG